MSPKPRDYVYYCLKGKSPTEDELNSVEHLADVAIIIQQIGQHVKHHYGEKGFLRLLAHVNSSRLDKEMQNHSRPDAIRKS